MLPESLGGTNLVQVNIPRKLSTRSCGGQKCEIKEMKNMQIIDKPDFQQVIHNLLSLLTDAWPVHCYKGR